MDGVALRRAKQIRLACHVAADEGVHGAAIADVLDEAAGVDVGDADDAIPLESVRQGFHLSNPAGHLTEIADDQTGDLGLATLVFLGVDAVVPDVGRGHHEHSPCNWGR